jgi:hypothetical protein
MEGEEGVVVSLLFSLKIWSLVRLIMRLPSLSKFSLHFFISNAYRIGRGLRFSTFAIAHVQT